MCRHHKFQDKQKIRKMSNTKLPAVWRRQAAQRAIKIRENIRKVLQDKKDGKSYGSGIKDPSKKEECETKIYPSCKKVGYLQKNHRNCTFSTYSEKKKKENFGLENVVRPMFPYLARMCLGTELTYNSTGRGERKASDKKH
jgi:hypothetical protein